MANGNVYSKPFNEAKVWHLDHFIELTLSGDKPYLVILHIGSNDATHKNVEEYYYDCWWCYRHW